MSCRHCCLFCSCAAAASCPPFPCHRAASHHPVQAYYFDAALTFGKQGYLGTGRDFVLRHLSFDDTFRAAGAYTQVQQLCGSGVVLLAYVSLRLPLSPLTPMSASSMAPPACLPACLQPTAICTWVARFCSCWLSRRRTAHSSQVGGRLVLFVILRG